MSLLLPPCFTRDKKHLHVIIETPKNSRNKFAYDPDTGLFVLKKILPAGLQFPCEMGFIPHTKGEDGDPLDAFILMDGPTYPGCFVECRVLGVIRAKQHEKKRIIANDRFIAVPSDMQEYNDVKDIRDLNRHFIDEIIHFLEIYNTFEQVKVEITSVSGVSQALKLIKQQLI